jgi:hypothetical protein
LSEGFQAAELGAKVEEGSSRNTNLVRNLDDGVDLDVVVPEQSKLGTGTTGTKPTGDSRHDATRHETYWIVRPWALKRAWYILAFTVMALPALPKSAVCDQPGLQVGRASILPAIGDEKSLHDLPGRG